MKTLNEEGTVAGDGAVPTDADTVKSKSKKKKKDLPKPIVGENGVIYLYVDWVPAEIVKDTIKAKELNLKIKPNEVKGVSKITGTKDAIIQWLEFYELCGGEMLDPCVQIYPKLSEQTFFERAKHLLSI